MREIVALMIVALALRVACYAPAAGATTPTMITECGTIAHPGSYVLAKNLTAAGNCLVVTADFVTIDLAGFLITGNGTGAGIREGGMGQRQSIAVRNGTIAGFEFGVILGGTGSIVEGVRAVDNTVRGIGAPGIIRGNTAVGNSIGIGAGDGSTVTGNVANDNAASGIEAGVTSTVSGNIARNNDGIGILAGVGSTVSGNTARGNTHGINASSGATVSGNTTTGNGIGIRVGCPSNVLGNTAIGNFETNLLLVGEGCHTIGNLAPVEP